MVQQMKAAIHLRALLLATTMSALSTGAEAQDQTLVVAPTPVACSEYGKPADATIEFKDAPALIGASLKGGMDTVTDPYLILNVMRYKDNTTTADKTNWYVYNKAYAPKTGLTSWYLDSRHRNPFSDTRIFGSSAVGVVYTHHNVPAIASSVALLGAFQVQLANRLPVRKELFPLGGLSGTEYNAALRAAIIALNAASGIDRDVVDQFPILRKSEAASDALPVTLRNNESKAPEAAIDSLQIALAIEYSIRDAAQAITALRVRKPSGFRLTDDATKSDLAWVGNDRLVPSSYLLFAYNIGITKKTPAPWQNLQDAVSLAIAQGASPTNIPLKMDTTTSLCGGGVFDVEHIPSDIAVTATIVDKDKAQKQLTKQTFDNEGLYWYDFSFALPLKSYQDLSYDNSNGTVSAKKVNKSDLFLVANIGLPFDTKSAEFDIIPRLLYGLPISGQPLKHHLLALAIGLNKVQLYGGYVFNQDPAKPAVATGSVTDATTSTWSHSFTWGLNVPVSAIAAALKPKK